MSKGVTHIQWLTSFEESIMGLNSYLLPLRPVGASNNETTGLGVKREQQEIHIATDLGIQSNIVGDVSCSGVKVQVAIGLAWLREEESLI